MLRSGHTARRRRDDAILRRIGAARFHADEAAAPGAVPFSAAGERVRGGTTLFGNLLRPVVVESFDIELKSKDRFFRRNGRVEVRPIKVAVRRTGSTGVVLPDKLSPHALLRLLDFDDVDAVHEDLVESDAIGDIVLSIRDEPWGQRHFMFRDPAGLLVDAVQLIAPSTEYAASYSTES